MSGFEIATPMPEGVQAADANVMQYRAVTEQDELIVQIAKQECINDMSGKKSDYKVSIDVKTNAENKYASYTGCGEYPPDYRINDIWILAFLNDTPVNKAAFVNRMPLLEIDLAQQKCLATVGVIISTDRQKCQVKK